ncbi:MAG: 30S ribosomal protein S2 [Bacteroidia bacterium]|nr:30S ribosomal protein S2 [Bacteroidia bacterium]
MAYTQQDLLDAGVHFGHLTRKWNPKMAQYIFMEQNGIHIIDLNKTESKLEEAKGAIRNIAKSGRKIMFVATKKQAKEIIADQAKRANMPFVTERWLGGMLTNFQTVRRSIKRMQTIDRMATDGTYDRINKKERLMMSREREKLGNLLGGIEDMSKLPGAIFVVDVKREHLAIAEAVRLGIPTFALVDNNSDPTAVDFPIPGNDDASKSIQIIVGEMTDAMIEGLQERRREKPEEETAETQPVADTAAAEA